MKDMEFKTGGYCPRCLAPTSQCKCAQKDLELIGGLEEYGNFLSKAMDWWNSLSGEDKMIRLVAYKKAFKVDINYPDEEQICLLFAMEIKINEKK